MTGPAFYYRCRHCATWAVTVKDYGGYVRCNGCGGSKKFEYLEHAGIDQETYDYAKEFGVAHLPVPKRGPRVCVRCEAVTERFVFRVDGVVCRACYRAEDRPPTPEEWIERAAEYEARQERMRQLEREMYERQDAATPKETR
jgi:hypothetical protein